MFDNEISKKSIDPYHLANCFLQCAEITVLNLIAVAFMLIVFGMYITFLCMYIYYKNHNSSDFYLNSSLNFQYSLILFTKAAFILK